MFQDESNRAKTMRTVLLDATAERNGSGRAPQVRGAVGPLIASSLP